MSKYLVPFLVSFSFTIVLMYFLIWLAGMIHWKERYGERHIHKKNIYRIGGLAMMLVFVFSVFTNEDLFLTPEIYGLLIGSFVLVVAGFWDDIREIYWKIQLFFQLIAAFFVFVVGVRIYFITNPLTGGIINLSSGMAVFFSVFLAIFWIILVINSINWLDGIDGLSGGVSLIACAVIFFLSLKDEVYQPPIAILSAILTGTILGFLIFNFNPAKAMAGTSGAMFMGFTLSVLAILAGTKIATAILVLAVPLIDFVWVIIERIKNGAPVFQADRRHLHYRLMEIGWKPRKIFLTYIALTSVIGMIALNTRFIGKSITLLLTFLAMSGAYYAINKRISAETKNENS